MGPEWFVWVLTLIEIGLVGQSVIFLRRFWRMFTTSKGCSPTLSCASSLDTSEELIATTSRSVFLFYLSSVYLFGVLYFFFLTLAKSVVCLWGGYLLLISSTSSSSSSGGGEPNRSFFFSTLVLTLIVVSVTGCWLTTFFSLIYSIWFLFSSSINVWSDKTLILLLFTFVADYNKF